MSVEEYNMGDVAECKWCGKEFVIGGDDDFDDYFYHVTTCANQEPGMEDGHDE